MNLFSRRKLPRLQPPGFDLPPPPPGRFSLPEEPASILLSEELRAILHQPVDPRTERIMRELAEEVAIADTSAKSPQIIPFPFGSSPGQSLSMEPPSAAAV